MIRIPVKTIQVSATAREPNGQLYDASLMVSFPLNAGVHSSQVQTVVQHAMKWAAENHPGFEVRAHAERTGYANVSGDDNVGNNVDETV